MLELNKIYQGDCLEVMKEFPDKYFDLTITSPPYNLGNTHHTGNIRHNPYEDNLPESKYQNLQIEILNQIYRITKVNGCLFYNHKNRIKHGISISPYQWILQSNWMVKQELVWFNRSQNFDKCRFYPMTERIYWLSKSRETSFYNNITHHDLFDWQPEGTDKEFKRAFPLILVLDILNCFKEASIILDPFMGSGTTAVACKQLDRNFIGIEINPDYVDIANKRLANTYKQLELIK